MSERNGTPIEVAEETREAQPEEPTPEAIDPHEAELAALREQNEAQAKRIDELARAYADALNERESFRRRLERESERQIERARGDVAIVLLDAAEDLRRAVEAHTEDARALAEGVRMIADNFFKQLGQLGLERIEAVGKPFDPLFHEAVDLVPTEDASQDGVVLEEARMGWKMGERVLRATRVRVGKHVPAQPPSEEA